MARELTHRLTALGRAHDLVRPHSGQKGQREDRALLGDLLTILLAPYDDMGALNGWVRVSVPKLGVGESAATILALVVHELATNSLKHGALSAMNGTLNVSCTLQSIHPPSTTAALQAAAAASVFGVDQFHGNSSPSFCLG